MKPPNKYTTIRVYRRDRDMLKEIAVHFNQDIARVVTYMLEHYPSYNSEEYTDDTKNDTRYNRRLETSCTTRESL